ncbi:MAG: GTP cyclohydrolase IIa [Nitrosopumilus sp.]|uniref:GTP cyclohydrolase III n=1 Tax=Nitrosopumilus zosterae TaxID=718286 RepID=A0A2S2KTM6_9ARCH|nr:MULTISPECIES: GTP cyclohydrolase IIa [Nitrosopumilus]MCV0365866.1 GTP cyclohydrolase IIa [Nitrosopumilus sp.]BDQ30078.1 GTP cyclohydrolase IIa [Nitrosopumilus zosterae]GBH34818.1 GTP cyclohydrolase IIa [Nitrosopumilus zosterae]
MIQLSILKITGYGPWTLTLGSDREHELQMLQASLYKEVQKLFSEKNCLVFLNRADEFFVITNGLKLEDHIEIQKKLENLFDIRLAISIGYGESPFDANLKAYDGKKNNIILNQEHNIFGFVKNVPDSKVSIMHLDVDDLTSRRKNNSPYEITSIIFELYSKMSKYFLAKNSLTFFMGGDNFMIIASEDGKNSVQNFINMIKDNDNISLNCGIGNAYTSREAAKLATKSLDTIREIRDSGKEKPEVYELSC